MKIAISKWPIDLQNPFCVKLNGLTSELREKMQGIFNLLLCLQGLGWQHFSGYARLFLKDLFALHASLVTRMCEGLVLALLLTLWRRLQLLFQCES